ncbi:MAG: hypothetical protein HY537_10415 [Deltaproteobacteria bacterium]|nr:hypothetical protein [Deltaproteobacteria bacterium]
MVYGVLFALVFGNALLFAAPQLPNDQLTVAAEYYYSKYDYRQSLGLWNDILKQSPANLQALFRLAELRLLFTGRDASKETILGYLRTYGQKISPDTRKAIRQKLVSLQSIFLTETGQSLFLAGTSKAKQNDCPSATALLNQAIQHEGNHPDLLWERAKCEKLMSQYDKFYETLKLAFESNPLDSHILDSLSEAAVFFRDYPLVISLLKDSPPENETPIQKTALAIALQEKGEYTTAIEKWQHLLEQQKNNGVHPIVFFKMGQALVQQRNNSLEAVTFLERFLSSAKQKENCLVGGWDPFHTEEYLPAAEKMLAALQ